MNQIPSEGEYCIGPCPCLPADSDWDNKYWCQLYPKSDGNPPLKDDGFYCKRLQICIKERPQIVKGGELSLESQLKAEQKSVNELSLHCQDLEDQLKKAKELLRKCIWQHIPKNIPLYHTIEEALKGLGKEKP